MAGVNPHSSMLTESIRNARRSEAKELLTAFEQGSATIQLGALRDCRTWRYASLEIDFRSKKRRAQQCGSDCPTSRLTNSMTCQSTTVLALILQCKERKEVILLQQFQYREVRNLHTGLWISPCVFG
jgi:hypothetical protein